jgi:hypothetical protein
LLPAVQKVRDGQLFEVVGAGHAIGCLAAHHHHDAKRMFRTRPSKSGRCLSSADRQRGI